MGNTIWDVETRKSIPSVLLDRIWGRILRNCYVPPMDQAREGIQSSFLHCCKTSNKLDYWPERYGVFWDFTPADATTQLRTVTGKAKRLGIEPKTSNITKPDDITRPQSPSLLIIL